MSLLQADEPFRKCLSDLLVTLKESHQNAADLGELCLNSDEVTRAILLRLHAYYLAQKEIVSFLGKGVAAAGADFFVESLVFYLRLLNETHKLGITVESEVALVGKLRPDITIRYDGKPIGIVECKTQLGRRRNGLWRMDFEARENILRNSFPEVPVFLVVMTEANWEGFGEDPRVGNQFFALLKKPYWPVQLDHPAKLEEAIQKPIEPLFVQIVECAVAARDLT
jgi:hypothetical protein